MMYFYSFLSFLLSFLQVPVERHGHRVSPQDAWLQHPFRYCYPLIPAGHNIERNVFAQFEGSLHEARPSGQCLGCEVHTVPASGP